MHLIGLLCLKLCQFIIFMISGPLQFQLDTKKSKKGESKEEQNFSKDTVEEVDKMKIEMKNKVNSYFFQKYLC